MFQPTNNKAIRKLTEAFGPIPIYSQDHILHTLDGQSPQWALRVSNSWDSPRQIDHHFRLEIKASEKECKSTGFPTREIRLPLLKKFQAVHMGIHDTTQTYYVCLDFSFSFCVYRSIGLEKLGIAPSYWKSFKSFSSISKAIQKDLLRG